MIVTPIGDRNKPHRCLISAPSLMPLVSVQGFLSAARVISPAGLALLVRQVLPRQPLNQVRSEQARGKNSAHLLPGTYGGFEEVVLQTGRCEETLSFFFLTFYEMKDIPFLRSARRCRWLDGVFCRTAAVIGEGGLSCSDSSVFGGEGGGNKG